MMIADFVAAARPPDEARCAAARAVLDTIGVMLAGALEPCARAVQQVLALEVSSGTCTVVGTAQRAAATGAALANGTAAHAHDFDDMCFVSLAHPSAPRVAAGLAAAELAGASGRAMLDAYVVGFELEARFGRAMNPRHYQRGWHCTSTLGTMGAAAASSRLLGLTPDLTAHALAIAASEASGLKENFGTMVKPLHSALAARNGVLAALLADGQVGLATFSAARMADPVLEDLRRRVAMHVDASLDPAAPALTQARVRVVLTGSRVLCADARGARGYPDRPASAEQLSAKFLACAALA